MCDIHNCIPIARAQINYNRRKTKSNSVNYFEVLQGFSVYTFCMVYKLIELTSRSRRCIQKRSLEDKSAEITVFFIMRIGTEGKGVLAPYILYYIHTYICMLYMQTKQMRKKPLG